ncbi:MAG: hypothetical protein OEM94_10395 [Acidimicrobiia bacterium]|nr:hypothetical protein [Acidimicrobiia bacterium]
MFLEPHAKGTPAGAGFSNNSISRALLRLSAGGQAQRFESGVDGGEGIALTEKQLLWAAGGDLVVEDLGSLVEDWVSF